MVLIWSKIQRPLIIIMILVLLLGLLWFDATAIEMNFGSPKNDQKNSIVWLPLLMRSDNLPTPPILEFEEQVVALINEERIAHDCDPLTMDLRLHAAAAGHSEDMAVNDYFSHYAPDGTSPWERILAQGYVYSLAGENIAAGFPTPKSVVIGWMSSTGHRANILNCGFIHTGVGYYDYPNDTGSINYRHYWTQVFATP